MRRPPRSIRNAVKRRAFYAFQKVTGYGFDAAFERDLVAWAREAQDSPQQGASDQDPRCVYLSELDLTDTSRYELFRDDIYERFAINEADHELDHFGRRGSWVPRGCKVYYDRHSQEFLKIGDEYYFRRGEGRYLATALQRGLYNCFCPHLTHLLKDEDEMLRGYSIKRGKILTMYEFERYVGGALRDLVCSETLRTGLYFYDLAWHNVMIADGRLSFIDLESVLPIEWFGKGTGFSISRLEEIDIGWEIQSKWKSPQWYKAFLEQMLLESTVKNP